MNNRKICLLLYTVLLLTIVSCNNSSDSTSPIVNKEVIDITNVIPIGQHDFTDIEITKNGKIYVVDNGIAKIVAADGTLSDLIVPAGFYSGFSPDYIAVAADGAIYLRGLNKLKKLVAGQVTSYEYQGDNEQPVNGEYSPNPFVQGNGNIEVNESDNSLLINFTGDSFDNLIKIKNAKVKLEDILTGPFKYFDVCQNGSTWSSGDNAFSQTSFLRRILADKSQNVWFNEKGSQSGAIDKVGFSSVSSITVSFDGSLMYFVDQNVLKKVKNLQVSIINLPQNFTLGQIALSPDAKTLYSIGAGIDRIDL